MAIRQTSAAFRKDDQRAAAIQPLRRATNHSLIGLLDLNRPCAQHRYDFSYDRPAEALAPCEVAYLSLERQRHPDRVNVGLMIRSDDDAAALRKVLQPFVAHTPEQAGDDVQDSPQTVDCPEGQDRRRWCFVRTAALRSHALTALAQKESSSPSPASLA